MKGDDRRIVQAVLNEKGEVSAQSLNLALKQLSEMVYKLEGRKGPVQLRDSLQVISDSSDTAFLATATDGERGRAEIAFRGTLNEELDISQGIRHDGDAYYATSRNPSGITFTPGQVTIHADEDLEIGQAFVPTVVQSWFSAQPRVRLYNTAQQSFSDGAETAFIWNTETFDTAGMFNVSASTTAVTLPQDGYYLFGYSVEWEVNPGSAEVRHTWVSPNGNTAVRYAQTGEEHPESVQGTFASGVGFDHFSSGTILRLYANIAAAGGTVKTVVAANTSPVFWVVYYNG